METYINFLFIASMEKSNSRREKKSNHLTQITDQNKKTTGSNIARNMESDGIFKKKEKKHVDINAKTLVYVTNKKRVV